jgi:glycine oxidase
MTSSEVTDVVILGDGLVALSCARAVAARGLSVQVVGRRRPGVASIAAAGFLAPTIDPARGSALDFTLAARARYPSVVEELQGATGRTIPFALEGIIRVASSEREAASFAHATDPMSRWLSPEEIAELEPALQAPLGGRFHPDDGWVDNQRLLQAMDDAVARDGTPRVHGDARRVEMVGSLAAVELDNGTFLRGRYLVVAAGAWSPLVQGLPRSLPVRPLRGQMMALSATPPVRRPIFGFGGYLVPRPADRHVIVGSTAEPVGFTAGTTDVALTGFRELAGRLVPSLARADEARTWSGFRPMTLDGLPILGADPDFPAILYACGHSRNGILLAPLTGDIIGELASETQPSIDISPFSIRRFSDRTEVQC